MSSQVRILFSPLVHRSFSEGGHSLNFGKEIFLRQSYGGQAGVAQLVER
ncbi:MAG: hypothetical protein ACK5PC_19420 [Cyclobacteriaceae bacterium]|nr:hypothetical protein [Flammeovirgaceae bacterium]